VLERVHKLLQRRGIRYLLVGGSVYVLEVAVILLAQHLGASDVLAVAIGFCVGLVVSFVLQKFVAFEDKRTHRRILLPQILLVTALVLFNFGFTLLVTRLLSPRIPAIASRTVALAITVTWNFYLYKTRIFKSEDDLIY
jgi:putative flippase GtrA